MELLNKEGDLDKFLQNGFLSKSFLSDDFIKEKVLCDYNHKIKQGKSTTILESLYRYINHVCKYTQDRKFVVENKFQRDAKEIYESGKLTGCTDCATLFATFSRQLGIPTTILHTAELGWYRKLVNDQGFDSYKGHTFCECFYDGKWILVDPTCQKIEWEYNPNKLQLSYDVDDSNQFISYFRGLDLGKRQTVLEHNEEMKSECLRIYNDNQKVL